jgi:hypothetical protein
MNETFIHSEPKNQIDPNDNNGKQKEDINYDSLSFDDYFNFQYELTKEAVNSQTHLYHEKTISTLINSNIYFHIQHFLGRIRNNIIQKINDSKKTEEKLKPSQAVRFKTMGLKSRLISIATRNVNAVIIEMQNQIQTIQKILNRLIYRDYFVLVTKYIGPIIFLFEDIKKKHPTITMPQFICFLLLNGLSPPPLLSVECTDILEQVKTINGNYQNSITEIALKLGKPIVNFIIYISDFDELLEHLSKTKSCFDILEFIKEISSGKWQCWIVLFHSVVDYDSFKNCHTSIISSERKSQELYKLVFSKTNYISPLTGNNKIITIMDTLFATLTANKEFIYRFNKKKAIPNKTAGSLSLSLPLSSSSSSLSLLDIWPFVCVDSIETKEDTVIDFGCFENPTKNQTHNQISDYDKFGKYNPKRQRLSNSQEQDSSTIIQTQQEVRFHKIEKVKAPLVTSNSKWGIEKQILKFKRGDRISKNLIKIFLDVNQHYLSLLSKHSEYATTKDIQIMIYKKIEFAIADKYISNFYAIIKPKTTTPEHESQSETTKIDRNVSNLPYSEIINNNANNNDNNNKDKVDLQPRHNSNNNSGQDPIYNSNIMNKKEGAFMPSEILYATKMSSPLCIFFDNNPVFNPYYSWVYNKLEYKMEKSKEIALSQLYCNLHQTPKDEMKIFLHSDEQDNMSLDDTSWRSHDTAKRARPPLTDDTIVLEDDDNDNNHNINNIQESDQLRLDNNHFIKENHNAKTVSKKRKYNAISDYESENQ